MEPVEQEQCAYTLKADSIIFRCWEPHDADHHFVFFQAGREIQTVAGSECPSLSWCHGKWHGDRVNSVEVQISQSPQQFQLFHQVQLRKLPDDVIVAISTTIPKSFLACNSYIADGRLHFSCDTDSISADDTFELQYEGVGIKRIPGDCAELGMCQEDWVEKKYELSSVISFSTT